MQIEKERERRNVTRTDMRIRDEAINEERKEGEE